MEVFDNFGYARNCTSGSGNQNPRPLYNRYFCHITIMKWSQIYTRTMRKGFFLGYLKKKLHFPLKSLLQPKYFTFTRNNRAREKTKTVTESDNHREQIGNMLNAWG